MPSFLEEVHARTAQVPRGKVTTYAAIARALGKPGAVRAVGNALNKNEDTKRVPCHRVVRSDGTVGGYALGTLKKVKRLRSEGIEVKNGRIDLDCFGYWFAEIGRNAS